LCRTCERHTLAGVSRKELAVQIEAQAIPLPPDFPVGWKNPEDANGFWERELVHVSKQSTDCGLTSAGRDSRGVVAGWIRDGQLLEVDGSEGIVPILEDA
jgi:hypothetical protein